MSTSPLLPSTAQRQALDEQGFFIQRAVVEPAHIERMRAALIERAEDISRRGAYGNDRVLEQAAQADPERIPPADRLRKLNELWSVRALWEGWYAHPRVLALLRGLLGTDILNKYASAFLKPARIGGPTPWHQDIGLWRDTNHGAANGWLAIDPSTRANGCLQVVPGSHRGPVIPHVSYPDSVHAELPREHCQDLTVEHIELQPGDAVFWHSNLWHYSPPNHSDQRRMGCGAVWINPAQISELRGVNQLRWTLRHGEPVAFPPPALIVAQEALASVG